MTSLPGSAMTQALVAGAVAVVLLALVVWIGLSIRRIRHYLDVASEEIIDAETGLMPRSAIRVRLGAELAWAFTSKVPLALAAITVRGASHRHAARVLRHAMREEEVAYRMQRGTIVAELWDAHPNAAELAARRLGMALNDAGVPIVDVGVANAPVDGRDVETLVGVAHRRRWPIDDAASGDVLRRRHAEALKPRAQRTLRRVLVLLPGLLAWLVLVGLAWRIVPDALTTMDGAGMVDGASILRVLLAIVGLPLAAALVHAATVNHARTVVPRSRPVDVSIAWSSIATAALIAAPLALGLWVRDAPTGWPDGAVAALAMVSLIMLCATFAGRMAYVGSGMLIACVVLAAGCAWLARVGVGWELVARVASLGCAVLVGVLGGRRASHSVTFVSALAIVFAVDLARLLTGLDLTRSAGSVLGVSREVVARWLVLHGPSASGHVLFAVGLPAVAVVAFILARLHRARFDVRIVGCVAVVVGWAAFVLGHVLATPAPLVSLAAGAALVAVAIRTAYHRRRATQWRDARAEEGVRAAVEQAQ